MNSIPFSRQSNVSPKNREVRRSSEVKKRIVGLAVNIASRIQDSTKSLNNSFLVSEEVIKHSSFNTPAETKEVVLVGGSYELYLMGRPYKN
jgi:class 3 adenylate cyclase